MKFNVINKTEQAAGGGGVQIALGRLAQDNAGARRIAQLLLENSALLSRLTPLLEPGELERVALAEPLEQLRGITALLERQKSFKRCRHLLEAWGGQRLQTLEACIAVLVQENLEDQQGVDMEARIETLFEELNRDALHYQELYYSERKHIQHLDQQRRGGFQTVDALSA